MSDEVKNVKCNETELYVVSEPTDTNEQNDGKVVEQPVDTKNATINKYDGGKEKDTQYGKLPTPEAIKEHPPDADKMCEEVAAVVPAAECNIGNELETTLPKQGVENKTVEATLEEPNESQDSLGLIIDEKMDEQEVSVEEDRHERDITNDAKIRMSADEQETPVEEERHEGDKTNDADIDKDTALIKADSKDSCEDISEVSVVTQIDAGELNENATGKLERDDKKERKSDKLEKLIKTDDVPGVSVDIATGVIEVDDEVDDEPIPLKPQSNNDIVQEDAEFVVKRTTQNLTVIEIDDEDEEEIKEDTTKEENTPQPIEPVIAMEVETEVRTVKLIAIYNNAGNRNDKAEKDKNIDEKMQEEARGTIETELQPAEDTEQPKEGYSAKKEDENALLKEAPPKSVSPTPVDTVIEDTTDEVFYNKECINYDCPKNHKQYFHVPQFAMSFFKVTKKRFKGQFICAECYDKALDMYEEYCGLLNAKQPLLLNDFVHGRQEFVEIIDSSDEDDSDTKNDKEKEISFFSKKDLELIETELESSIEKVLQDVDIQSQLTWSKTMLSTRVKKLEEDTNHIDDELRALQKKADNMHVSLYQCPKIKIRQLQPLDLNSGRPYAATETFVPQLPVVGEIQRPFIQLNEVYYAVKNKAIASWVPCKVIEQVEGALGAQKNLKHYKVKFLKSQYQMVKTVSAKHLAYYEPPNVRLPIGTRVIAYFDATTLSRGKEKMMVQSAFYPGIIAEPLKPNNKYRYLIFYDDGYTQYVYHRDVRLVCHVSENVWEDVHPGSRDFIQKYLTQYSINRPMVQTQKGQSMTTESKGKWIYARVVDIDCSLIQMQFEGSKSHTEWIYRGSMRLGPVFKEYQKTMQKDVMPVSRLPRRAEPFIRYTEDEDTITRQQNERNAEARAVAKKSVSSRQDSTVGTISAQSHLQTQSTAPVPIVRHLNNSTIYVEDENKPKGKVVYYTAKRNLPPLPYKRHNCDPTCLLKITHNLNAYSPLSKPLLSGWERMIIRQKIKKVVTYRAPCGKIMRNMRELHQYLRTTDNVLNVDNFDFSPELNCLAEYVIESAIVHKRDISGGQEKMAIPLVNYYDNTLPPECKYAAQRIPTEGVDLNLDPEFLVGCDCEDDCSDKAKCSCWQLTYAGAKYGNPNTPMEEIGYQYKRLYESVPTGIYECSVRCKCKSNCLNRVVQQQLQMKLQVFKTSNRGWGLRCLNDIPRGSFICIYAGHLLTEAKANEGGLDAGDEYFAELDYIESAEKNKEGYESDVEPPEPEEEEEDLYDPDQDDDDEFTPSKSYIKRSKRLQRSTRSSQSIDEDSQERQVINFNPNADMNENSVRESSVRKLFGKDETCYIMDAKTIGNLGRYFNHSCSPNLFVQNVFVDTHDLRFPWVAFFAQSNIRSGTELTWNYNYEVGVVPGKVLYCQCGAPNCRLRLL